MSSGMSMAIFTVGALYLYYRRNMLARTMGGTNNLTGGSMQPVLPVLTGTRTPLRRIPNAVE